MLNKTINKDAVYIELRDNLEIGTVTELIDALKSREREVVILDFKNVTYIGSTFLGCIVKIYKELFDTNPNNMILAGVPKNVYKIFEMTGTNRIFKFVDA